MSQMMTLMTLMMMIANQTHIRVSSYGADYTGNSGRLHYACVVFARFRRRRSVDRRRRTDHVVSRCAWRQQWRHHWRRLGTHVIALRHLRQFSRYDLLLGIPLFSSVCLFVRLLIRVHVQIKTTTVFTSKLIQYARRVFWDKVVTIYSIILTWVRISMERTVLITSAW